MKHATLYCVQDLAERCMGPVDQRPTFDAIVLVLQEMQQQMQGGTLSAASFPAWEVRAAGGCWLVGLLMTFYQDPEEEQAKACGWDVDGDTSSSSGAEDRVHRCTDAPVVQVVAETKC